MDKHRALQAIAMLMDLEKAIRKAQYKLALAKNALPLDMQPQLDGMAVGLYANAAPTEDRPHDGLLYDVAPLVRQVAANLPDTVVLGTEAPDLTLKRIMPEHWAYEWLHLIFGNQPVTPLELTRRKYGSSSAARRIDDTSMVLKRLEDNGWIELNPAGAQAAWKLTTTAMEMLVLSGPQKPQPPTGRLQKESEPPPKTPNSADRLKPQEGQ